MITHRGPHFLSASNATSLLPLREVERRLGLTRWTLYQMIHTGRLPAVKLRSGHYRVPAEAVDAWVQGERQTT